jgi:hypothetical protein
MTGFTTSTLNYPQDANTAIRRVIADRDPTTADKRNFTLGDEWLNQIADKWWKLAGLDNVTGANWIRMSGAGTGIVELTGNSGGPVTFDINNNVNVVGSAPINIVGTPLNNTLTVSANGTLATLYTEDAGTATPSSNNLNILGGTGISTSGAGHTVTIGVSGAVATTYQEDAGSAAPSGGTLHIVGGTGVNTSGAGSTVTINAMASVPLQFDEDAGSAVPAANIINIVGGAGISTSGAGDTVTITALAPTNLTFTENTGTATPAANNINVKGTATNGITTTGAGDTVTVAMNSPYADGDFDFQSTSSGATRTLTTENTSNTAASQAVIQAKVAGTSAGDAWFQSTVGSTRSWAIGADTSDSQSLKINTNGSGSVSPSTGLNTWDMTAAGIRTLPLQPVFQAFVSTTINSVTGDGTLYTPIYDNVVYNRQGGYDGTTGIFTAPVDGIYMLVAVVNMGNVTSAMNGFNFLIQVGTNQFQGASGNPFNMAASGNVSFSTSVIIFMSAGDQANAQILISHGTKVASIIGKSDTGTGVTSYFTGALLF